MELGDRVYPATVRAGGSRAATPAGPPTTLLLGRWELGTEPGGWEGRRGGSAGVSQGHEAKESERRKETSREKTKLPKMKTQTHQSGRRQARAPGPRAAGRGGALGEAGGQEGCSHPAGLGHCQDSDPGLGPASECLVLVEKGGRGVVWFGTTRPKIGEWGETSLWWLQPSVDVL